ncbi:hypothetical protein QBC39DRAFT_374322 [Podospora conica]|nr:hypothetical protein QBC39DRAFT_374322 [Schizothecium conicum]
MSVVSTQASPPPSPRQQQRDQILAAANAARDDPAATPRASHLDSDSDHPRPRPQLTPLTIAQWDQICATFTPPAHPDADIHFAPVIWALRRLEPNVLRFLAASLHQSHLNKLDTKTAERLRSLAHALRYTEEVVYFAFASHPTEFLCDTACRALRYLSKKSDFDLCHLLERIQARFDDEVRDQSPECREKRFALKLLREAVNDINPAAWRLRGTRSSARAGSPSSTIHSARSPSRARSPSPPRSQSRPADTPRSRPAYIPQSRPADTPHSRPTDTPQSRPADTPFVRAAVAVSTSARRQEPDPDPDFTMDSEDFDVGESTLVDPATPTPKGGADTPRPKKRHIDAISLSPDPPVRPSSTAIPSSTARPFSTARPSSTAASLQVAHLRCLDAEEFLNDTVINTAVAKLVDWVMGPKRPNRPALAVDSLLLSANIGQKRRDELTAEYHNHDVLFLPTHDAAGAHWMLFRAVRPLNKHPGGTWTLERYDSLGGRDDANDAAIRRFLSGFKIHCGPTVIAECTKQPNIFDCGIYVVAFVQCLLQDLDVKFPPVDSIQAREKLRSNLLQDDTAPLRLLVTPDRVTTAVEYAAKYREPLVLSARPVLGSNIWRLLCQKQRNINDAAMRYWCLVEFGETMLDSLASIERVPHRPEETRHEKRARLLYEIEKETFTSTVSPDDNGDQEDLRDLTRTMLKMSGRKFRTNPAQARAERAEMHKRALGRAVFVVLHKISQQKLLGAAATLRGLRDFAAKFAEGAGHLT